MSPVGRCNCRRAAVATLHPVRGPLTEIEYDALCQAVRSGLASAVLSLADRVAVWLSLVLGPRPIQIAALKVGDIRTSRGNDGTLHYVLMVPDVKQRRPIRTSYRPRLLPQFIGELVVEQAEVVRKAWQAQGLDPSKAPLLPRWMHSRVDRYEGQGHYTSRQLSARVIRALRKVAPHSERTGAPLEVNPSRLRYTMGTRAAAEGLSDAVIAWLLGHSNTQSVGVYRGLADELALRISHTMSLALGPLARAFQGIVVEPGHTGAFNIVDPRFDETMEHPIGSCSACGPCDLGAPIDCYVCPLFLAWRDGPHEAVHDFLRAERDRLAKTCGERVAAANDLVILAVADVVHQCRATKDARN